MLDGSLYENDLTQALLHAVCKDLEVSSLIRDHLTHPLVASDSESKQECKEPKEHAEAQGSKRFRD